MDALYSFCQQIARLRSEDADEVYRLNQLSRSVRDLVVNVTPVGNAGGGEDNLMGYAVPPGVLTRDGEYLEAAMGFTFAANANNKRVRVYFGSTLLYDTSALALNDKAMSINVLLIRKTATSQVCMARMQANDGVLATSSVDYTAAAETLAASTLTLKATGEATSDNDVVQQYMTVKWFPANIELA